MSTTYASPHIKGSGWRVAGPTEGSLWGVKAEIWELERKLEVVDGKAEAHYHKRLEKPKWDWEALQKELSRMR